MMNSTQRQAVQEAAAVTTVGKKLARKKLTILTIAVALIIIAIIAAFIYLRPGKTQDFGHNLSGGRTIDNFLVRNGRFDCTTLNSQVPIGLLQQIPGMVNKRQGASGGNVVQGSDGSASCSMSFVATGDSAGLRAEGTPDSIPAEPGTPQADALITLRNTLISYRLPMDYRSFVVSTARTCTPLRSSETTAPDEDFTDPAGAQWLLGQSEPSDNGVVSEVARLSDDRLGCVSAAVLFPEGSISPKQSTTAREFLRKTVTAMAEPLSASISAAKGGNQLTDAKTDKNKTITAQPTFLNNNTIDCRSYIFNASLTQQREVGIVSDFDRIPGDFVSSLADAHETPLYKIAPDGSSVACWFTAAGGEGMAESANLFGAIPVTAIATSPQSNFALPQSAPVSEVVPDAVNLGQWRYFLHVPGNSVPLSQSGDKARSGSDSEADSEPDSQPSGALEFENSLTPTLNLYRCGTDDTDEAGSEKDANHKESHNCLILSTSVEYSLDQDYLKALSQVAKRIDPLF